MITIDSTTEEVTLINVFLTDAEHQQALIDVWTQVGKGFLDEPGFVSAALHRRLDGTRVVNYAQWDSAEAWQAATGRHRAEFARFHGLGTADPHLYRATDLRVAGPAPGAGLRIGPTAETGLATVMHAVHTETAREQDEVLARWAEATDQLTRAAGFVGAAAHRGLDGLRVVNYAQFDSVEAWRDLTAGDNGQRAPWSSLSPAGARPSLYEIVSIDETD